jgi:repressor LexA
MENTQGRRGPKKKQGENAPDLRQMDLWTEASAGSAGAHGSGATKSAKNAVQAADIGSVSARTSDGVEGAPTPQQRTTRERASVSVLSPAKPGSNGTGNALPALTRRQLDLLDYLRQRGAENQRPPSLTEICRDLGLVSRGSLHKQIVALVQAGLVEAMHGKQRGVRLVAAANDGSSVPLLGSIAAGRPIEALTRDESVALPGWMRGGSDCYALRVKGDSMRDVGILDGDVVVIEPREQARNGETVVALIDGAEATLKRIEQRPGMVVLHAENPAFAPQRYEPERVQIQGVVVAQLRRYRL